MISFKLEWVYTQNWIKVSTDCVFLLMFYYLFLHMINTKIIPCIWEGSVFKKKDDLFQSQIQSNPQTALWFVCLIKLFPIPWQLGTKHLDLSLRESEGLKISSGRLDDLCMHVCYVTSVTSDSLWPMDCSPPSSSVHGILQARILEWLISLLQEIFPTQGLNPLLLCLLHWQARSLPLSHLESP